MCIADRKGDFYRGCGCFKPMHYTGKVIDCNQPDCGRSAAHMHKTSKSCYCTQTYNDNRLVRNYLQTKCEDCMDQAALEEMRRGRRLWR